jgi:2-hydroxy-3-oxopropionate reductase
MELVAATRCGRLCCEQPGRSGAGQVAKVSNEIIVALNIVAVAQALVFASKPVPIQARSATLLWADCFEPRARGTCERMFGRTFNPEFRIALHQKDLNLALQGAKTVRIALPQTTGAGQLMETAATNRWDQMDHTAVGMALVLMAHHVVSER